MYRNKDICIGTRTYVGTKTYEGTYGYINIFLFPY